MTKTEIRRMVSAAAAACEGKKAERILVLELDPADSGFTDYFLISSGANQRQNQAIADAVEMEMKRGFGTIPNSIEGYRQGDWILLDYVDFVVHVFSNEKRDFYDIERLRRTAVPLTLEELKASVRRKPAAVKKKAVPVKSATKKASVKKASVKKATKEPATKKTVSSKAASKKGEAKKLPAKRPTKRVLGK